MRVMTIPTMPAEFDDFLYAPICQESNGMLLRAVSVLARSDLDPWEEASRLAALPGEMAARRLAGLIAALPVAPGARQDPAATAASVARVIALLPQHGPAASFTRDTLAAAPSARRWRALTSVVVYALIMLFLLCAQWLLAGRTPPGDAAHAYAQEPGPAAAH
jgi:hypothetical protein